MTYLHAHPDLSLGEELAERLRRNLAASNLTQTALCERVGITQKHLSQMLNQKAGGTIAMWDRLLRESRPPAPVPVEQPSTDDAWEP